MVSTAIDRRAGLSANAGIKGPCVLASVANLALAGLAVVDGVATAEGDRILVRAQSNATENGIYIASAGDWERAKDFKQSNDLAVGSLVYVANGATYAGNLFALTYAGEANVGTTAFTISPFSTPAAFLLAMLLTVDGAGSGLDADLLDGLDSAYFLPVTTAVATYMPLTALGAATPLTASATGVVGVSALVSRQDHQHPLIDDNQLDPSSNVAADTAYFPRNIMAYIPAAMRAAIVAGTSTDDHLSYIQTAVNTKQPIYFPAYSFNLGGELVIPDGGKLIGAGGHIKRRTGEPVSQQYTEFKYIGVNSTLRSTSVTSLAIGTGSKTFTTQTAKGYTAGQVVMARSGTWTAGTFMVGTVTSYNSGTGALVVNVLYTSGTGTLATWNIAVQQAVVRASNKAVGLPGTSFSPPGDDLMDVTITGIHIRDASKEAQFGWYLYRIQRDTIGDLSAEGCLAHGAIIMGIFGFSFGVISASECAGAGIAAGWDVFGWLSASSHEAECFPFRGRFFAQNNGTDNTWVKAGTPGTGTDLDDAGIIIGLGRDCDVWMDSEQNFGRGVVWKPGSTGSAGGPSRIRGYFEGNGDGPGILYTPYSVGATFGPAWVHPGSVAIPRPQNISIIAQDSSGTTTTDQGPGDYREWLTLQGLVAEQGPGGAGVVAIAVWSNTSNFFLKNSSPQITFSGSRSPGPDGGTFCVGYFKADSGLTDTRVMIGAALTRVSAGKFRLTFTTAQLDSNYIVTVVPQYAVATVSSIVSLTNKVVASVDILVASLAGVLNDDSNVYVNVTVQRLAN